MDREELLAVRKTIWNEYETRKKLGEFDANSKSILICFSSLIEIVNHLLEEMKKKK